MSSRPPSQDAHHAAGDDLIVTKELAAYLRRPVATVRWWRSKGLGPPGVRLGRGIVYRRADVDAWINEQERAERERRRPR